MPKQYYYQICSYLISGKLYSLRLVVQRGIRNVLDYYFEYGAVQPGMLMFEDSIWSSDPDLLVDHMPVQEQFHACMDVRIFLRDDLRDALDGSLMTDEFEVVLDGTGFAPSPELPLALPPRLAPKLPTAGPTIAGGPAPAQTAT